MPLRSCHGVVVCLVVLGWCSAGPAQAQTGAASEADRHFEELLAAAKKEPEKTEWKALRHAFAETSLYHPYSGEPLKQLTEARKKFKEGDLKTAEALLVKLQESERSMRLDTLLLLGAVYNATGQKEKESAERAFIEGIVGTLFVPGTGMSFDKPIEVLFIDEEYFFLSVLEVKSKSQGLKEHDGHWFDVLQIEPKDGLPAHEFYFNVDLPRKSLGRMLPSPGKPKDKA
jgi:Domain of unknown function (DUF4919)